MSNELNLNTPECQLLVQCLTVIGYDAAQAEDQVRRLMDNEASEPSTLTVAVHKLYLAGLITQASMCPNSSGDPSAESKNIECPNTAYYE